MRSERAKAAEIRDGRSQPLRRQAAQWSLNNWISIPKREDMRVSFQGGDELVDCCPKITLQNGVGLPLLLRHLKDDVELYRHPERKAGHPNH
jgi:hypothetical protein